jgi:uncharacterized protein YbgA (DUF1722 family)
MGHVSTCEETREKYRVDEVSLVEKYRVDEVSLVEKYRVDEVSLVEKYRVDEVRLVPGISTTKHKVNKEHRY